MDGIKDAPATTILPRLRTPAEPAGGGVMETKIGEICVDELVYVWWRRGGGVCFLTLLGAPAERTKSCFYRPREEERQGLRSQERRRRLLRTSRVPSETPAASSSPRGCTFKFWIESILSSDVAVRSFQL